ncbi:MAG: AMP-binding protein [Microthrixaceae bacterium]|jgi:acyl-CoA synthetase (AMP-forming)/AMP-acid ligase II|nr:AMP-binding protein [Microthrixaceae bacterium]
MTTVDADVLDLPDRVLDVARRDPGRVAVVEAARYGWQKNKRTTYAQLSARAESLAVGLRRVGVREGVRCSFMVPPGEDAMVVALALWRVGAAMVGIEPHSHGLRSVARSLKRVQPEMFFGTVEAHAARVAFGWGKDSIRRSFVVGPGRIPGLTHISELEDPWLGEPVHSEVGPSDAALIAFTTGSTGDPKPTVMTYANVNAMVEAISTQWSMGEGRDVVDMPTFPIFWIVGMAHGGTVIVPPMNFATKGPGSANPAVLVRTIREHNVRSMFGSPALLANLSGYCNQRGITLGSIRRIVAGGAEITGPLYEAVGKMIPNGELFSNYGATEVLPATEIGGSTVLAETWPLTETGHGLCVGAPMPGVELKIVAIDDGDIATMDDAVVLGPGEIGEVVATSPHVSDRYYEAPNDMAANKIENGDRRWHRLGDCGFLDDTGRLWVCGRRSHRVVTEDRAHFPLCCEPVINTHPEVERSALVGLRPASGGGPVPAMCIQLRPEARDRSHQILSELKELADRHDATRGIDRFVFVDLLPVDKRHNAKIDRPALAAEYSK